MRYLHVITNQQAHVSVIAKQPNIARIFIAAADLLLHFHLPSPLKKSTFSVSPQHSRMGSSKNGSTDPVRKYGVQDPNNKSNFTCNFCGTVVKGGAYRLKQHLIGGFKDAKKCPNSPEHVKAELRDFMENKQSLKAQQLMQQARFQLQEPDEYDEVDEEDVAEIGSSRKPPAKSL
ncbi:hypothetical protein LXL04_007383 [Taraxacum kok-saghyz]